MCILKRGQNAKHYFLIQYLRLAGNSVNCPSKVVQRKSICDLLVELPHVMTTREKQLPLHAPLHPVPVDSSILF